MKKESMNSSVKKELMNGMKKTDAESQDGDGRSKVGMSKISSAAVSIVRSL
jgi:hypothetical protein